MKILGGKIVTNEEDVSFFAFRYILQLNGWGLKFMKCLPIPILLMGRLQPMKKTTFRYILQLDGWGQIIRNFTYSWHDLWDVNIDICNKWYINTILYTHTHTHTHTWQEERDREREEREREREREREERREREKREREERERGERERERETWQIDKQNRQFIQFMRSPDNLLVFNNLYQI